MNAQLLDALKTVMLACPTECSNMVLTGDTKTVGEIFRAACELELMESWTPADKALPDDELTVLIALDDGEVWTGFMDAGEWRYVTGDPMAAKVLYWMNLPEPPK